jgi:D-alanyl-D-alanine carboxypeptidase
VVVGLRVWAGVVVASLLLAGCSGADRGGPGVAASTSAPVAQAVPCDAPWGERPEGVHAAADSLQDQLDLTADGLDGGVVIAQGARGAVRYCVAGRADSSGRPLVADDVFRIFSVSKTFTAVMVMQLVEEGQLTLETDVAEVLPDLDLVEGVTVRQLLDHTGGLAEFMGAGFDRMLREDWDRTWTAEEVLDRVAMLVPPLGDPGTVHAYSNTHYVVAGMVVEEVTGLSLADNLQARITGPLGLTDTAYAPDGPDPVTGFALWLPHGSSEDVSLASVETALGAAGGMVSTAPDLVTFISALGDGELVSSQSWDQMTDFTEAGDGERFGLGLFEFTVGERTLIGHIGAFPGFTSVAAYEPETSGAIVLLTNDDNMPLDQLVDTALATP